MKNKIFKHLKHMENLNKYDLLKYKSKILNGSKLCSVIENKLAEKLSRINTLIQSKELNVSPPKLKIILVGDKLDSKIYVKNKIKKCKLIGMSSELKNFSDNVSKQEILEEIEKSNLDQSIHGIIVQLPLTDNLTSSRTEILSKVDLQKDVDGLNPLNQGRILQMKMCDCLIPPTALGVLELLRLAIDYNNNIDSYVENYLKENIFDDHSVNLSGLDVTIIGRGLTAGLPLSILMQICHGTVTVCHSKTRNIRNKCENADILISAVGKSMMISKDYVKPDCIVIDVGINVEKVDGKHNQITGDVEFDEVIDVVKYITPVPGGVGKMTVIMLLKNVLKAWSKLNNLNLNNL